MTKDLNDLTKEELVAEINNLKKELEDTKFKLTEMPKFKITTESSFREPVFNTSYLIKKYQICIVSWDDRLTTRTVEEIPKDAIDTIGLEVDVLRPYVGYKRNLSGCIPEILKEDATCSCFRVDRLSSFDKSSLPSIPDETYNKILQYWDILFKRDKPTLDELKKRYEPIV